MLGSSGNISLAMSSITLRRLAGGAFSSPISVVSMALSSNLCRLAGIPIILLLSIGSEVP